MASPTLLALLAFAAISRAQNSSICSWQEIRAGVVRDSWWLEGGLQFRGSWENNEWQNPKDVSKQYGSLWKLNFSQPFDSNTNVTTLLEDVRVISESTSIYIGGTMFTDNDEFYTMGGLAYPSLSNQSLYQGIIHAGLYRPNAQATGFTLDLNAYYQGIPSDVTKYVTQGAGANAPSESLGFYFSGLSSPNGSRLSFVSASSVSENQQIVPRSSMTVASMQNYNTATFAEYPLPDDVAPRAGASMVWVPAGSQGVLVVIGGVTYPADLSPSGLNSTLQDINQNNGSTFLTNIPVYDIASKEWYVQSTTGTAPQIISQACAVVASASDSSSHNIYLYGGFDATTDNAAFDDVWVLSIPSFKWIKASNGNSAHGRYGHSCAKPYPNQMLVMGGVTTGGLPLATKAVLDNFDLNSLTWTGRYDPEVWSEYKVPSVIRDAIGGSETGGSTSVASGMSSDLRTLLAAPYTKPIARYYPYTKNATAPVETPVAKKSIAGPVAGGVVAGVVVIVTAFMAWFCLCSPCARRKKSEKSSDTESPKEGYIHTWMHGTEHPPPAKSIYSSDATEIGETTSTAPDVAGTGFSFYRPQERITAAEVDGSSQQGHTRMYSNTSAASIPNSPGSHTSAELEATTSIPFLSQLDQPGSRNTDLYRNHPYYPASIGANSMPSPHGSDRYAHARSPSEGPFIQVAPAELPNKSSENVALVPPRLDLNRTKSDRSATETSTDISAPSRSQTPEVLGSQPQPGTKQASRSHPPVALANVGQSKNNHHSHTSSASSGMAITLSPTTPDAATQVSPGEDQRRSDYIDRLPDQYRPVTTRDVADIAEESEANIRNVTPGQSAYQLNNQRRGN